MSNTAECYDGVPMSALVSRVLHRVTCLTCGRDPSQPPPWAQSSVSLRLPSQQQRSPASSLITIIIIFCRGPVTHITSLCICIVSKYLLWIVRHKPINI